MVLVPRPRTGGGGLGGVSLGVGGVGGGVRAAVLEVK